MEMDAQVGVEGTLSRSRCTGYDTDTHFSGRHCAVDDVLVVALGIARYDIPAFC